MEAIARQVPAQGLIFLRSIVHADHATLRPVTAPDPVSEPCELCDDQPGHEIGQQCALCVAAISWYLVYHYRLMMQK